MIFADPALGNVTQRNRIQVMKFLPPKPERHNEIRSFEQAEVFGDGLARHVKVQAKFSQGLAIMVVKLIEQFPTTGIGQCFEHKIHFENMHLKDCISSKSYRK